MTGGLVFLGIAALVVGFLMVFAGGMSDAPVEGGEAAGRGCTVMIVGLVLIIIAIVRWLV